MNCLHELTYETLTGLVEDKLKIARWQIYEQTTKERLKTITEKNYYKYLYKQANKKLFNVHSAEILSWIDTLNLLYYSLENVEDNILNDITILQEYKIPFSNKRADYLLVYQNKILILEFSFDRLGDTYKYETKLNQAIGYKELLTSLLPSNIEIGTYTFIIEAEVDKDGNQVTKWNRYSQKEEPANNEKIESLGKYISLFFKKESDIALNRLSFLEEYEEKTSEEDDDMAF